MGSTIPQWQAMAEKANELIPTPLSNKLAKAGEASACLITKVDGAGSEDLTYILKDFMHLSSFYAFLEKDVPEKDN